MINPVARRFAALGAAVAIALAAAMPVSAAPMSGRALVSALPSNVDHVRWRRGAWIGAGIGAGLAIGAIAASRPYYGYGYPYYGPAYGYPAPVYDEPVYVAPPVYAAPPPARVYAQPLPDNGVRQCFVTTNKDQGLGYWQPC
jgi:hypothetical protein